MSTQPVSTSNELGALARALVDTYRASVGPDRAEYDARTPGDDPRALLLQRLATSLQPETLAALRRVALREEAIGALALVPTLAMIWRSSLARDRARVAADAIGAHLGLQSGAPELDVLTALICTSHGERLARRWRAVVHGLVEGLSSGALGAVHDALVDCACRSASSVYGPNATQWPRSAFAALNDTEQAFFEVADGDETE